MKLRAFTICSAFSAILSVAACALWVQSYKFPLMIRYDQSGMRGDGNFHSGFNAIMSRGTQLSYFYQLVTVPEPGGCVHTVGTSRFRVTQSQSECPGDFFDDADIFSFAGFHYKACDWNDRSHQVVIKSRSVVVPIWSSVGLSIILPILWLARIRWNPAYYARRNRSHPKTIWIERATFVGLVFGGASAGAIILLASKISQAADEASYPLAALALILVGSLAALVWRRIDGSRQMATKDLCPHCGYDLRASPARCPECGMSAR